MHASRRDGASHDSIVDDYGGDTLLGEREVDSNEPLALGEITDFFLGAWPLLGVLQMNFDGGLEGTLDFLTAESAFYPEFALLCRRRVIEHFSNGNR